MTNIEALKSVVHRRGPLTKKDYSEAIGDLKRARMQDKIAHICCSICEDTGHTAETCNHNPLLLARKWSEATSVWVCYHCGFIATNDDEACEHFGFNEQVKAECLREQKKELERLREFVGWIDTWISNPARAYSHDALEGLFGMTRDKIAVLVPPAERA